jgi:NADH-quinone oxidoreductase subunit M
MTLLWLLLTPFIGGLLCGVLGRGAAVRVIAVAVFLIVLALCAALWQSGDYSLTPLAAPGAHPAWTYELSAPWIPRWGIRFGLGLDGLSLLLIALTGVLGLMAVACSWHEIAEQPGFFHLNLLWTMGGVMGVFLATDLFLLFVFWEVMLVPMFFLIALWGHDIKGGKSRIYAATQFFIFTQASGLLMLVSILALVLTHEHATGTLTFSYAELLSTPMSPGTEAWIMLGFLLAFAVKLPVVPLHTWLPDAHSQAPTAGSVVLAGVLLKTAAYGLLRFLMPLFPHAAVAAAPVVLVLGDVGIIYSALCACGQNDLKRLIAYTSISHMGFILIGVWAGTELALQGVVIQILAHGLSAGGLFMLAGQLYERLHTRDLSQMGGLAARLSRMPPLALFFVAASLGLPGLGNFLGEFLVLAGTFPAHPWVAAVAASGLVLSAIYSLLIMQRAFHGPAREERPLPDLSLRELGALGTLAALLAGLGLYPQPVLDLSRPVAQALVSHAPGAGAVRSAAPDTLTVAP